MPPLWKATSKDISKMTPIYRLIDALCWRYEDRFPCLANAIYDWLIRRGFNSDAWPDDPVWEGLFARSHDKLEVTADRVRANRAAGRSIPLEQPRTKDT